MDHLHFQVRRFSVSRQKAKIERRGCLFKFSRLSVDVLSGFLRPDGAKYKTPRGMQSRLCTVYLPVLVLPVNRQFHPLSTGNISQSHRLHGDEYIVYVSPSCLRAVSGYLSSKHNNNRYHLLSLSPPPTRLGAFCSLSGLAAM